MARVLRAWFQKIHVLYKYYHMDGQTLSEDIPWDSAENSYIKMFFNLRTGGPAAEVFLRFNGDQGNNYLCEHIHGANRGESTQATHNAIHPFRVLWAPQANEHIYGELMMSLTPGKFRHGIGYHASSVVNISPAIFSVNWLNTGSLIHTINVRVTLPVDGEIFLYRL
jgi:hypothetical protein